MRVLDQMIAASAFVIAGLVTFGLCLPLIRRKVGMNRFYGVRIPQAFVSDARWYEINEYGGRLLARWSWPITFAGIIGFLVPTRLFSVYLCIALPILLVSVLVPLIQTIRWARETS